MALSPTQGTTFVQAIYSFKGKNNDELCFKKGDIITVTQKEEGGWWEGTLAGTTGWFPSNYVKEHKPQGVVIDGSKSPPAKLPDLTTQQKVYRNLVLKDLIDSEKAHVAELQTLITNFLHPLEKSDILNRDEYRQLVGNIESVVETHSKLLIGLEACNELPPVEQRVGKLFLTSAPQIKQIHLSYCSSHPRAICILNKHKDALNSFMETQGAASPGLLVLTTGLSKPFRRLEKYSGILQELERHIEESHPDRGDTQRSFSVYKDIWSACSAKRRQKEQELEILTGGVRGWEGEELSTLGEIIHMGSVAVGPYHRDRYLVLFPTTLLILSVSSRMSGFIYEGKLPLTGINVTQLADTDSYKNAFEITGTLIDKIIAVCQTKEDQQVWVDTLRQAILSVRMSSVSSSQSNPPSHVSSFYTCPYSGLTEYYARLVKSGVITRTLLKRLLYRQFADESVSVLGVKVRRSHKVECVIFPTQLSFGMFKSSKKWFQSQIVEVDRNSTSFEEQQMKTLKRQNAVELDSESSEESCDSDCFGYIRYFSPKKFEKDANGEKQEGNDQQSSKELDSQSSFDVPVPVTHRACEDLSALEIIGTLPAEDAPTRNSLPSLLCSNVRHSIEVSHFERSASLDLIDLLKLNSNEISLSVSSEETVEESLALKETSQSPSRRLALEATTPNCPCQLTRISQGLPGFCYQCRNDVLSSPRSSDSGLADISGTTKISPSNPQDCAQWNSRAGSFYNNFSLIRKPGTAGNFECQCVCSSSFGTSPRESAQLSLTSKNIFLYPSCSSSSHQASDSWNQNSSASGVYRSGMYAHWWLKTCIPAESVSDESGSSGEAPTGKISVPLTMLPTPTTKKSLLNKTVTSAWSMTVLKPLPPMRHSVALGKHVKNKSNLSPKKPADSNFEEDIQILRVIEAYCSSAKTRSASSSGESANVTSIKEKTLVVPEVSDKEKYVMENVNLLRTQLTDLSQKVNVLSLKLDEEIETRTVLQNSVKLQLSKFGNG